MIKKGLLVLSVIHICNYDCEECTMRDFMCDKESYEQKVQVADLIKYLETYLPPEEWDIRITGGEPGLFNGINDLVSYLSNKGYRGVIETNGSLEIRKFPNFIRLACWHKGYIKPEYADVYMILDRIDDCIEAKIAACDKPYEIVPIRGPSKDKTQSVNCTVPENYQSAYQRLFVIYDLGHVQQCPTNPVYGNILDDPMPEPFPRFMDYCANCPQIQMADYILNKYEAMLM